MPLPLYKFFISCIWCMLVNSPCELDDSDIAEKTNNIEMVRECLQIEHLNLQDINGKTILHHAAICGHKSIVKVLLDIDAGFQSKSQNRYFSLMYATFWNSIHRLKEFLYPESKEEKSQVALIKHNLNIDLKDENGCTALMYAAMHGHADIVRMLIDRGADIHTRNKPRLLLIDRTLPSTCTALDFSAINGHADIAQMLIDKGADINGTDWYISPLRHAASNGKKTIVEMLINARAEIKKHPQSLALNDAAWGGHTDIVEIFINKFNLEPTPALISAIKNTEKENTETVQILLNAGANINSSDASGSTPLHYAVRYGHANIFQRLIDKNADVNYQDKSGFTPLHWAATSNNRQTVEILLNTGADVHLKSEYGETALTRAAMRGHANIVKMLIDKGADVNQQDAFGFTPLHWALLEKKNANIEVMQILINAGADISLRNEEGKTPLDYYQLHTILSDKSANIIID